MSSDSNLIQKSDIVTSDLNYVEVDQGFVDANNLGQYDVAIVQQAMMHNNGQTDYQARNFVANSQITPYKKVRQALMELEVRHHAYMEIKTNLRKAEVLDRKFGRDIQAMTDIGDDISAEMIQIDRDKNHYDIGIWQRKLRQSEIEIKTFLDIIKEYAPDEESLKFYTTVNDEEERKYWILRMGKQAAMDILAFGRLGSGNMDSIAMMSKEEQVEALTIAIQYSGIVNANVSAISNHVQQQVEELVSTNKLEIPLIEDGLEVESNVFSAIESKVNGERLSELPGVSQA